MSTRGVVSFKEPSDSSFPGVYHVYKHSDMYPTGAAKALAAAKVLAWRLPRYEADEFAAAFVAANKMPFWCNEKILDALAKTRKAPDGKVTIELENPYPDSDLTMGGGGVRLLHSGKDQTVHDVAPPDIQYRYEVYVGNDKGLRVRAYDTNYWDDMYHEEVLVIDCKFDDFMDKAKKYEKSKE